MKPIRLRRGLYAPELLEARIAPATFLVNSLADDGSDGTLRKEIADANAAPGADTIAFDKALTGIIPLTGTQIPIKDTLTIKGPGIDILTISGGDARRIFEIDDLNIDPLVLHPVIISGLTFIDGRASSGSFSGGAIESHEPLTLKNVAVLNSFSGNHGGGVSVVTTGKFSIVGSRIAGNETGANKVGGGLSIQAAAGISIVKTTFANNTAGIGGGLYAQAAGPKATLLIDSCVFTDNTGTGRGGGLFVDGLKDGKIVLKNSLITGNKGGGGGGLYQDAGNLTVSKTTFSGNSGSRGGALVSEFSTDSTLVVTGSRFIGNHATSNGGAMYLGIGPQVKISGSIFAGNTADKRGGAITVSSITTRLDIDGSSFLGNSAALDGGAFYVRENAEMHMKNSVLSGNHADGAAPDGNGGAIWTSSGKLTITGSKFTENKAANFGGAITITGNTTLTLEGNLIQGNASQVNGGGVYAKAATIFTSKSDKFIGNVAITGQGGGVYLVNTGAITVTGSLFQSNVANASGGAVILHHDASFTGVKILDNITGAAGRGGGLRISDANVLITKSVITGNVANEGGGIYRNLTGVVTLDASTIVKGNAAARGPNLIGVSYVAPLVAPPAGSATIIVNSLRDDGDGANTTLREAILLANDQATHPGADTIAFKIPAADLPGVIVLNGTEIPITDALTIKGLGIDLLTVSGNDLSRIFRIDDGTGALKPTAISGLTLTHGKSLNDGGALYSSEPLTLENVVVRSSYSGDYGGGVFVTTNGKVSISNSRIVHNEAKTGAGGLFASGSAGVSIVKSTISNNTAKGAGGLYAGVPDAKSILLIDACIVANNTADTNGGGGIKLFGAVDGRMVVKNSLITGNSAVSEGGGLYLRDGNLLVTNTTFSNNTAKRGGGLADSGAKSLTISGSRFLRNSATDAAGTGGGGLYVQTPSVVKITATLFAGNASASDGGAISDFSALATSITGSSFIGNTAATFAGAIRCNGAMFTMKGSILTGNSAGDAGGAIFTQAGGVLNLTGNKFTENKGTNGGALGVNSGTVNLSGNLFQANIAQGDGGAVFAGATSVITSKSDKFIGNLAATGQGGGVNLSNTGGIFITGSLFQSNVAGSSGGGLLIANIATLTSIKVLDNVAGPGGRGGGIRIGAGITTMTKSVVTGNVANDGGGIFYNAGTVNPIELVTANVIKGNAAGSSPNIGKV